MLIDTHAHLWDKDISTKIEEVLERAREAGVKKIVVPGDNYQTSIAAIELAKKYPGEIFAAVGYYPGQIRDSKEIEQAFAQIRKLIVDNRKWIVAIGEIGLDSQCTSQQGEIDAEIFLKQMELAAELDLPAVVHNRGKDEEIKNMIEKLTKIPLAHFHCFSGTSAWLSYLMGQGFYVGLCGNVTYKSNRELREVVKEIPSDRLLLETDTPYLPPQGKRGEKNEPCNVKITAQTVAEVRGTTLSELAEQTTENAERLFNI